ncbi:unnamed protein product [Rotaria sp. Silwood1]|nr:unnamed protein product [Rotaria sp. Silwood1]
MEYYYSRTFILFLFIMIVVDDSTNALKIRLPSLRITSTFTRTSESVKKKNNMNNNGIENPAKTISCKIPDIGKKDDL